MTGNIASQLFELLDLPGNNRCADCSCELSHFLVDLSAALQLTSPGLCSVFSLVHDLIQRPKLIFQYFSTFAKVGIFKSWHIPLRQLCWNSSESWGSLLNYEVFRAGQMDS